MQITQTINLPLEIAQAARHMLLKGVHPEATAEAVYTVVSQLDRCIALAQQALVQQAEQPAPKE